MKKSESKKRAFIKKPITTQEQIELFKKRGLNVGDEKLCLNIIEKIGYYRLSDYTLFFERISDGKKRTHKFYPNTSFDDVYKLYSLDNKLRHSIFKLTTELEIYFKSKIASTLSNACAEAFVLYDNEIVHNYNERDFTNKESNTYKYKRLLEVVKSLASKSIETSINHYRETYQEYPKMPLWIATEVMTFGNISTLYSIVKPFYIKPIRMELGLIGYKDLISWLHTITYLRNLCAHNCRMFNRAIAVSPRLEKLTKIDNSFFAKNNNSRYNHRIYQCAVMLDYIVSNTTIQNEFITDIFDCLREIAQSFHYAKKPMGILFADSLDNNCENIVPLYSL